MNYQICNLNKGGIHFLVPVMDGQFFNTAFYKVVNILSKNVSSKESLSHLKI